MFRVLCFSQSSLSKAIKNNIAQFATFVFSYFDSKI
jgi:hypothetical protein